LALAREWYADFGPMLAAEKLAEDHSLKVSRETLRKWMAEDGCGSRTSSAGPFITRACAGKASGTDPD
jgi:hypothetical protein